MDTYWKFLWEEPCAENEDPVVIIAGRIEKLIDENVLAPGEQLPAIWKVKTEFNIPERMVRKVYHKLEDDGLLVARKSYGFFVKLKEGEAARHWLENQVIKLNENLHQFKPHTFRVSTVSAGFVYPGLKSFSIASFTNFLQGAYTDHQSDRKTEIQSAISAELSKYLETAHVYASPGQCTYVLYKEVLPIICSLVFNPGDTIVMDSAEDLEALMAFAAAGLRVLFTGSDRYGMLTAKLEEYCRSDHVKAVFVQPPAGYPANVHLSPARRSELVRIAGAYDLTIIANDSNHELWRNKVVVPVAGYEHGGRLIYYSSLSKVCTVLSSHAVVAATPGIIRMIEEKVRLSLSHEDLCTALGVCRIVNDSKFRDTVQKVKKEFQKRLLGLLKTGRSTLCPKAKISVGAVTLSLWIGFKKPLPFGVLKQLLDRFKIQIDDVYLLPFVSAGELTGFRLGVTHIEDERLLQVFKDLGALLC